jgi:CRISPR system Cascade subunit CasB
MSDERNRWQSAFIEKLRALAPPTRTEAWDRATLAHLRRGLGKGVGCLLYRVGWLFAGVPDTAVEDAVLLVSLFASYPEATGDEGLGAAFHRLQENPSVEKRFVALVDSDKEELPGRLRQAVSLLKAKSVSLGWARLLADLRSWDSEFRWVQRRWAREFWAEDRNERSEINPNVVIESPNT